MPARLAYTVASTSSEDEFFKSTELLDLTPETKGWMSGKYCIYPQNLILKLDSAARLEKIQILLNNCAIPTQVELHVGDVPKGTDKTAKNAMFMPVGSFKPESNEKNDFSHRQVMHIEMSGESIPIGFLKFVFQRNYQNKKNQYNQVGLVGVNLIGQPVESFGEGNVFNINEVFSPYDDISFLAYTDKEIAQLVKKLEEKKLEAASTERFEYAKKIKDAIEELTEAGVNLGIVQMEKRFLVDSERYEEAKQRVEKMDSYRFEVYKILDMMDLLETQGLVIRNDQRASIEPGRVASLFHIIRRDRNVTAPSTAVPTRAALYGVDYPQRASSRMERAPSPQPPLSPLPPTPVYRSRTPSPYGNYEEVDSQQLSLTPSPRKGRSSSKQRSRSRSPSPRPRTPTPPRFRDAEETEPKIKKGELPEKLQLQLETAIAVFGKELVTKCVLKSNVNSRLKNLEHLEVETRHHQAIKDEKPVRLIEATSQMLTLLLADKIQPVFQVACRITQDMYKDYIPGVKVPSKILTEATRELFQILMSRAAAKEERVSNLAMETVESIIKCRKVEDLSVLDDLLTESIEQKSEPKIAATRVKLTQVLVEEYGISDVPGDNMSLEKLIEFGTGSLRHSHQDVRDAGQQFFIRLYRANPSLVKKVLFEEFNERQRKLKLRKLFDEIDEIERQQKINKYKHKNDDVDLPDILSKPIEL